MKVLAKQLAACSYAVAIDDVRYYLKGICFSQHDDKLRLQATNGHILVRTDTDEPAPEEEIIIEFTSDQLRDIRKRANADSYVTFSGLDDPLTSKMELGGTVSLVQVVDGKFPDCNKIWPTKVDDVLADNNGLDAKYLVAATKVEKAMNQTGKFRPLRIRHNSNGPTLIEFPNADVEMIIMPIRC